MQFDILSSTDKRISGWFDQQHKPSHLDQKSKFHFSITLSRQFGCEGYPLALALKKQMEQIDKGQTWTIFDRALIDTILQNHQISRRILENFGKKSVFYDSLMSSIIPNWKTDADIYELMVRTIISLGEEGRAIFVGRGAAVITQESKRCFHFRLIGDREYRIHSLMQRGRLTRDEVIKLMDEKEQERDRFINRFLSADITAPDKYHMVFNNEKSDVDTIASTIVHHTNLQMKALE